MQNINIRENGLTVEFGIREDGIVELLDFTAEDVANAKTTPTDPEAIFPVVEVQVTGKTTRHMHAYKHNAGSASFDFRYDTHSLKETANGKELVLQMKTGYGLEAAYHMQFFNGIPAVRTSGLLLQELQPVLPHFHTSFSDSEALRLHNRMMGLPVML